MHTFGIIPTNSKKLIAMTVLVIPHTAHMAIVAPIDPALLTTPRGLKNIPVPITAATLEPIKVYSSILNK